MSGKRLTKSSSDIKIAGVCGGIAEYFETDPTLIRIAWIIFVCLAGAGLIAYILAALIMPRDTGM